MAFFDFIKRKQSLLQSGVLQGMTDRHCHILFGVDDGIQTLEDSLAVLAYDEEVGIRDVWCTPHIMEDVPNATEALRERFAQLQQAYTGPVRLHLAAGRQPKPMPESVFTPTSQSSTYTALTEDL